MDKEDENSVLLGMFSVVKCWLFSSEWRGSSHGLKVAEIDASSEVAELLSIKTGVEHLGLGVGGCITKSVRMLNTDESSSDRLVISACTDCTWLTAPSAAATFKLLAGSVLERFDNGPAQSNNVNWRLDFDIAQVAQLVLLAIKRAIHTVPT